MTPNKNLIAVESCLEGGVFSSERVFEVTLADGTVHAGIAPRYFCWDKHNKPVTEKSAQEKGPGLVAARVVEELADDQVAVEVPDGEVIAVRKSRVRERPTEVIPSPPGAKKA